MNRRKKLKEHHGLSGLSHLAVIYAFCLGGIFFASTFLSFLSPLELLVVPAAFLIANFVEYFTHRWPMHQIWRKGKTYKDHSGDHHRFFTNKDMEMEESNDLSVALTKVRMLWVALFGAIIPLSFLFSLFSMNAGLLFFISVVSYYMLYELTHLSTHLKKEHWLTRMPYFKRARQRHQLHHNTRLMHQWNFNVSFALADRVFGTLHKDTYSQSVQTQSSS
jgi:hypothetical protein